MTAGAGALEGVETEEKSNNGVTITPRDPNTLHNFGPASPLDETVYTSERPGGDPEGDARISTVTVQDWIQFMKARGISAVLILLDDNELECYESPGLVKQYQDAGLTVHHTPLSEAGSSEKVRVILEAADDGASGKKNEKVVAHCTHGMGRSGRVAAGWLTMKHGMTPEEATKAALETARAHGMERMGNIPALKKWLGIRED
eukprot:CAMPEP_0197444898 /NCGR_PEP_ID=MMETSP1175-20131217/10246_1 /TAXON_ID=1003142 /ORGANISM="Triceratium dubium, Strain CCMP147" /LENGTH=202 /DNA_ID=CAMNT_0042975763 /DNA_START=41 /DNA_END=649 /DNA_ORIENTATION=-